MNIKMREYEPADQQRLAELFNHFQDYLVELDPLKRLRRLPEYGTHYLEKTLAKVQKYQGKFLVVELEGTVIGFIVGIIKSHGGDALLEHFPSTYGEVIELYIEPAYRVQHIGTQLIQAMELYFKKQRCDVILIEVFEPNQSAQKFYTKHDYNTRDRTLIKVLK